MLSGLGIAAYYLLSHVPVLQVNLPAWLLADGLWWGIQPVSAGVFGVPAGLIAAIVVSWMTRPAPLRPQPKTEM
jgi:cation/acetate symporter